MSICELCSAINEDYRLIEKNNLAFAIVIIEPLTEGHLMVLPVAHRANIGELTAEESQAIMQLLNKLALALRKVYKLEPLIVMNYGLHGTQEHVHFANARHLTLHLQSHLHQQMQISHFS